MIVLKFGGTSVGTAKSIRQVVEIVTRINEPKVVVLSAVSGTTNSLVEINNCIESINKDKALLIVHQLHNSYLNLIGELFKSVEYKERARSFIAAKFNGIKTIIESNEQENTENIIVAQGEILSTNLVQLYLEESDITSSLISALDFMEVVIISMGV